MELVKRLKADNNVQEELNNLVLWLQRIQLN